MLQTAGVEQAARCRGLVLIAACILFACSSAWSQTAIPKFPTDGDISAEQVDALLDDIQAQEGLEEEIRAQVIEQLRDARAQIQNRAAAEAAAAAFAASMEQAPLQTQSLQQELDKKADAPTPESLGVSDASPLNELEQALTAQKSSLSDAEAELAALESKLVTAESRPAQVRRRIDELRAYRDTLSASISAEPPPGEPEILTDARRLAGELRRAADNAELLKLDRELLSQGARQSLQKARRDVAQRTVIEQQRRVELLQTLVNAKRQAALTIAQQEAVVAELAAADKHPVVRALAEENAAITRRLPTIADDIKRVTEAVGQVEAQARQLEQGLARSRQRLDVGGLSQVVGRVLLEERRTLPKMSTYRNEMRERRKTVADVGLSQVLIEERRYDLLRIDERVDDFVAEAAATLRPVDDLESIHSEIRLLLQNRRDLLSQAASTYGSYLQILSSLDAAQQRLLDAAQDYIDFLDKNLMWVASAPIVGKNGFQDLVPSLAWAFSPQNWAGAAVSLLNMSRENSLYAIFAALLVALAFGMSTPLGKYYRSLNKNIGSISSDRISLTLRALAIAALRAAPVPLALATIGWMLANSSQTSDFGILVSRSLMAVAPFLFNVFLYRVFFASEGVARIHFGWHEGHLAIIRRQLDRFAFIGVPLVFVTVLAFFSPVAAYRESLGRLAFVALMLLLSSIIYPLVHPSSGLAANYYKNNQGNWKSQLRWIWFALACGGPLLLAVTAMLGYLYAALVLTGLLIDTFWLILGIIIVNLVVRRWLALARRRIEWQELKKRQEVRLAEPEEAAPAGAQADSEIPVIKAKPLDLDAIDQQTMRLLNAALFLIGVFAVWGIWAEVMPALAILDTISLWSQTTVIDGQEIILPVTLADLLLALVIVVVTAVASRNLPGLMELAVLQRLSLEPGSRYAINTLVRYVVVTIGVIAVLNIVGWKWSQLQWMVAALSVGLGFGLQEIVANFVSGLIILFERPVRIGDTVTVGELTGTVSRVRIRATTITDWDRKEIIVPNKSFITEQVINWTLADPITRIVIPVGISYGSDVQLAHKIMQETLGAMPLVLDDPPPRVYFVGFGDSSLNFNLYVYSRQLVDRLPLTHAVHEQILEALRKNGIEIPFPQRDLHLRSVTDTVKGFGRDEPGNDTD